MDSRNNMNSLASAQLIPPAERRQQALSRMDEMLQRAEREELTGDVNMKCSFRRGRMFAAEPDYPERTYFGD